MRGRIARHSTCAALLAALLVPPAAVCAAQAFEVGPELWDRPRTGRMVLSNAAVRQALDALRQRPDARLAIRHASGAEPVLQAEELRAWLIAHAVEPNRIDLRPDLAARQSLRLEIVQ